MVTSVEIAQPSYTISGTGPYAIVNPYGENEITVVVTDAGEITPLVSPTDFTVAPTSSETAGDVTLSAAAATAHDGKTLVIDRVTVAQMLWAGKNPREIGLEAALDRMTRVTQDILRSQVAALKVSTGIGGIIGAIAEGYTIVRDASGNWVQGPNASDISDAQANAAAATAAAAAAATSQTNAAASASAAATAATQSTRRLNNEAGAVLTDGTGAAYTIAAENTIAAYEDLQGFTIRIHTNNTGAATLNVDGLGAMAIQRYDLSGALVALAAGDLRQGQIHRVVYDGTRFILVSPLVNAFAVTDAAAGLSGNNFDDRFPTNAAVIAHASIAERVLVRISTQVADGSGNTVGFLDFNDPTRFIGYVLSFWNVDLAADALMGIRFAEAGTYKVGLTDYGWGVGWNGGTANANDNTSEYMRASFYQIASDQPCQGQVFFDNVDSATKRTSMRAQLLTNTSHPTNDNAAGRAATAYVTNGIRAFTIGGALFSGVFTLDGVVG